MAQRKKLEELLLSAMEDQNKHIYFQPPEGFKLTYPCIVYKRAKFKVEHADNIPYLVNNAYSVTYITRDPDSETPDNLAKLPRCSCDTNFVNDNLYHWVYTIFHN